MLRLYHTLTVEVVIAIIIGLGCVYRRYSGCFIVVCKYKCQLGTCRYTLNPGIRLMDGEGINGAHSLSKDTALDQIDRICDRCRHTLKGGKTKCEKTEDNGKGLFTLYIKEL